MNGVIGQVIRSLKCSLPSRAVPLGPGVWRKTLLCTGSTTPASATTRRATPRTDRDPRVVADRDVLDADDQRVAALRSFEINRTADGVGEWWRLVEARTSGMARSEET
jgi:hypothetical protein